MSGAATPLRAPEPLAPRHDLSRFANGVHASLDEWLRERARQSEGLSARTYVVCTAEEPNRVVGYFSIASAVEQRSALPSARLRRGMPERVPLLLIGRLAVDARAKRKQEQRSRMPSRFLDQRPLRSRSTMRTIIARRGSNGRSWNPQRA
jgi:hypothetical protein